MLEYVIDRTGEFISSKLKARRKSSGQFFTSATTARFMAGLFTIPPQSTIRVLDPGAGSGILSAAMIEMIEQQYPYVKEIELTCYETDRDVIPLLEANIEYIKNSSKTKVAATLIKKDYLLSQSNDFSGNFMASAAPQKYDLIIGNPPYFKLTKDAPQAVSMPDVCYGTPNIYFLFAAMSLFNLREGGEMVYIIPRSWTSGAYFSRFRNYLLGNGRITDIHTFTSRNKVFDRENVLQETMIMKLRKTSVTPSSVRITSSPDSNGFENITELLVPYDSVVSGAGRYVHLITSREEVDVLRKVNIFKKPLPLLGMRMKTGLTVDFRNKDFLRNASGNHIVPLFYSQHIKGGRVIFPIGKENEYISDELSGMMQFNRNYLFVKRFTAKEERRRLQCAVYLANNYPNYQKISTQNKLNFIDTIDGSHMSEKLVFGLYIVLNSTLYDKYYRILNGSTQVNATEMNSIPMPERKALERLGQKLMSCGDNSTARCDKLLEEIIYA